MNYPSSIKSLPLVTIATLILGTSGIQPANADIYGMTVGLNLNLAQRNDFENNTTITDVGQFKYVRPTDEYFMALQSLTERYGVVVAAKDSNFHAKVLLSRGQFALFLDRGLRQIEELATVSTNGKYTSFKQFSANKLKLKSVSEIKDLAPASPYFVAVKSLTERYGINFVDADRRLRPEKTVTAKELYAWLDGVFTTAKSFDLAASRNINRGQFVMIFNEELDNINVRIADWLNANPNTTKSQYRQKSKSHT